MLPLHRCFMWWWWCRSQNLTRHNIRYIIKFGLIKFGQFNWNAVVPCTSFCFCHNHTHLAPVVGSHTYKECLNSSTFIRCEGSCSCLNWLNQLQLIYFSVISVWMYAYVCVCVLWCGLWIAWALFCQISWIVWPRLRLNTITAKQPYVWPYPQVYAPQAKRSTDRLMHIVRLLLLLE